jgi:prophage regulatory protein
MKELRRQAPPEPRPSPVKILRIAKVMDLTGLPKSSIYWAMHHRDFPKPIALGPRAVGWLEREVTTWLEARIEAGRTL